MFEKVYATGNGMAMEYGKREKDAVRLGFFSKAVPLDNFTNINICNRIARLTLVPSDENKVEYRCFGGLGLKTCCVKDGTLIIEPKGATILGVFALICYVTVYYKSTSVFQKITISNTLGASLTIGGTFQAEEVTLKTTSGKMKLGHVTASQKIQLCSKSRSIDADFIKAPQISMCAKGMKIGGIESEGGAELSGTYESVQVASLKAETADVQTKNAPIRIGEITAKELAVSNTGGNIRISNANLQRTAVKSTSGAVELAGSFEGDVGVTTYSGRITLLASARESATDYSLHTRGVNSKVGGKRFIGEKNTGACNKIVACSKTGSIELRFCE